MSSKKSGSAWTLPAGKLRQAEATLYKGLGENWGADIMTEIADDQETLRKTVRFLRRHCWEDSEHQRIARAIMGENMLDVDDVMDCFGVRYSKDMLRQMNVIPFGERTLCEKSKTHLLVAGYHLTMQNLTHFGLHEGNWMNDKVLGDSPDDRMANQVVMRQWHLVRKGAVPGTLGLSFEDQAQKIPPWDEISRVAGEVITPVALAVYTTILYRVVRNRSFYTRGSFLQCRESSGKGFHYVVTRAMDKKEVIVQCNNDHASSNVAMSSTVMPMI